MITLTRLDGKELVVNADHILTAESTPDTVLLLGTGLRLMVRETIPELLERVAAWRRRIGVCPVRVPDPELVAPPLHGPATQASPAAGADHGATVLSFPGGAPRED